ncbi:MAG TPA: site-specific DNA-methyltransferase [Pyrinomonadaceae bacterium]|jgi:DNA modification methylase|nr:site-specific DNA-methyltransferase [Pyrinomonadaceae bacterium]
MQRIALPLNNLAVSRREHSYKEILVSVLSGDLNFQSGESGHLSHKVHSFPAKFPPQLPRKFIRELTNAGDVVLDPMQGSGTTLLEALLEGRQAIGFDIDPLALLLSKVKLTAYDTPTLSHLGTEVVERARKQLQDTDNLEKQLAARYNPKTRVFIDYWFAKETQLELIALLIAIEEIATEETQDFFKLAFSSVIITKTGGVSLALDLAHTRPHRAKVVVTKDGRFIVGEDVPDKADRKIKILTKILRSPIEEFDRRVKQNLRGVLENATYFLPPKLASGNSQSLQLENNSVDLIVSSPPYASNAIDYMRAHKFSLVWLGYSIENLMQKRKTYIGGEGVSCTELIDLPAHSKNVVERIHSKNRSKGLSLHRYYSEMFFVLKEMHRVLKLEKAAIVVVGNSILAGEDVGVPDCLAEIGKAVGFEVPRIGVRQLDRNKRMLPAGMDINKASQIQQRMHEEHIIGFYKTEF